MKKNISFFALSALSVFVLFGSSVAEAMGDKAQELGFVPHKALYEIRLAETKSGSQIVNIGGQMLYEWEPSCEGWTTNHRFNLSYEYADSPAMRITSDFSTFESFDGRELNFTSQRKRDGHLFEELRGRAYLEENKDSGKVLYSLPEDLSFVLPQGTKFPMAHSLSVLEHIKAGKEFYSAVIFDGSDEEGPVEVNSFIGESANPLAHLEPSADLDMELVNTPAYKVRLAFFPLNNPSEAADYEMTIIFHENGIISDMYIEYDDFSVSQKLVALEAVKGSCEGGGNNIKKERND